MKNPFDITLTDKARSCVSDTDSNGLNDASEFKMGALGFDWQENASVTCISLVAKNRRFAPLQIHRYRRLLSAVVVDLAGLRSA